MDASKKKKKVISPARLLINSVRLALALIQPGNIWFGSRIFRIVHRFLVARVHALPSILIKIIHTRHYRGGAEQRLLQMLQAGIQGGGMHLDVLEQRTGSGGSHDDGKLS